MVSRPNGLIGNIVKNTSEKTLSVSRKERDRQVQLPIIPRQGKIRALSLLNFGRGGVCRYVSLKLGNM
jgi:hypothetical protein